MSDTTKTIGPDRGPTADGYIYPNPKNRWEERESFKLLQDIPRASIPESDDNNRYADAAIVVSMISNKYYVIIEMDIGDVITNIQRVREININEGYLRTNIGEINLNGIEHIWKHNGEKYLEISSKSIFVGDFVYIYDINTFGRIVDIDPKYLTDDRNLIITAPIDIKYVTLQTTIHGGVYNVDESTGEITVNTDMLPGLVESNQPNVDNGGGIFVIIFYKNEQLSDIENDIEFILPFGFQVIAMVHDKDDNLVIIIQRDEFLFPEEIEAREALKNEQDN